MPEHFPIRLAYLAGFFDGEGSISVTSCSTSLKIVVTNTDRRAVNLFQKAFGGAIHTQDRSAINRKTCYQWYMHGKKAGYVLNALLPHLVVKKRRAEIALIFLETYWPAWRGKRTPQRYPCWELRNKTTGKPTSDGLHLRGIALRGLQEDYSDSSRESTRCFHT